MKPEWITAVWNLSQKKNILATNSHFDEYRVPIFYQLEITSIGLNEDSCKKLKILIERNGGLYTEVFRPSTKVILIQDQGELPNMAPFIAQKILRLTPNWVMDSGESGYALPILTYGARVRLISAMGK